MNKHSYPDSDICILHKCIDYFQVRKGYAKYFNETHLADSLSQEVSLQ